MSEAENPHCVCLNGERGHSGSGGAPCCVLRMYSENLVRFIPRYFIFLVATSSGIFFPDFCFCSVVVGVP